MRNQMREEGKVKPAGLIRRLARGQAMVEYTLVTHALMIGGGATAWAFSTYLLKTISIFYESVYWVLTSSVP